MDSKAEEKIIEVDIADEVKKSYLAYALSVIIGRALPDVRDGLKPVHRRILYAMYLMGLWHNKPYKKSARVVGEVLGKFHPHGDQAIYDALVRMAQDFVMNIPLIDGHGNFGSVDGDSPAAMRYTEVRLSKAAEKLLEDIDKETVDFVLNFDSTLKEPLVLPAKMPNLLVNGSVGIAVGMATNIPPHNLNEVVDALKFLIDNRDRWEEIGIRDIMNYIKGPDFPTKGIIYDADKLTSIYEEGRGSIEIWSKADIEEGRIIVKEIPYLVNKASLVEEIAKLVKEGKLEEIKDIRDESNREGIRIVIELKKGVNEEKVLTKLYALSNLKVNFPIMLVALKGLEPKQMSLKEMLIEYIKHRFDVLLRKAKYELKKAEERKHILDGLMIAIANIDETVRLIKTSKNREEARNKLMNRFNIDEVQANAILDMPLAKLTNLETEKIKAEIKDLEERIGYLKKFISNENMVYDKIKEDLDEIKEEFGFERRTEVHFTSPSLSTEIKDEKDYVVVYTNKGYVKKIPLEEFKEQKRGGKGLKIEVVDGDKIRDALYVKGYDKLLVISNKGKAYNLDVSSLEISKRHQKGKTIYAYLDGFEDDEKIGKILKLNDSAKSIVFLSKHGIVKRTSLESFKNIRKTGIIALNMKDKDEIVDATLVNDEKYFFIVSSKGKGLKFKESLLREMGRTAVGVKGITLKDGYAKRILAVKDIDKVLLISSSGYGKFLDIKDVPVKGRASQGVIVMNLKDEEEVELAIKEKEEYVILTEKGNAIRTSSKNIPTLGRNSRGVRIIKVYDNDRVVGGV